MKDLLFGLLIAVGICAVFFTAGFWFTVGVNTANNQDEDIQNPTEYTITAYCPCEKCCGRWADGHFANGQPATGLAIAAPPNIPFGTTFDIPGYGVAEVKDRGSAIQGNRLDVFFEDKDGVSGHQRALEWGVQTITVKELKK